MKSVAIILARSGSKRIKDKNIKMVAGQPLFFYPVECAKQVSSIDKVVLSTDSKNYAEMAQSYGVDTIIRPKNLSYDNSKAESALLHTIKVLEENGEVFDTVVMMQPTNPIVYPKDIEKGLALMEKEQSSSVVTYTEFKGFFIDDSDILDRPMSQDKTPRKLESGAFWITKVSELKATENRICQPVSYLKIDNSCAVDIDTQKDLEAAEAVLEKIARMKSSENYYISRPYTGDYKSFYGSRVDPDGVVRDATSKHEMNQRNMVAKDEIDYVNQLSKKELKLKVLDLGCGTGSMSDCFNGNFQKYGLEIPESITETTKQSYDKDKLHIGYLDENTFSDNFFDIVFCFHVLEHVPDPIPFVKSIARILKTHGELIISLPNFDSAMANRFGENYRMLHDQTHCSLFGSDGLKDLLEDSGFKVNNIEYPFFNTEYFTMENMERLFDTSKVSPPFYGNIMTMYVTKK
jgi:CMP-N-acetylneuraminic acid synthetase/2-polyprenyl-3-methyl-5-hydroxy-6-metoxy-1,4-benzoquinol methylase